MSAARNRGIEECREPLILFLDADDLVDPTLMEQVSAPLEVDPDLIGATCGWARLGPAGEVVSIVEPPRAGDLFPLFARGCAFPIHSCIVRTDDVRLVGGFDEGLATCEDWDLWLRLTRIGRPIASVAGTLSLYRMRERSASVDGRRMLLDGLEVLERSRRPDPRVPRPHAHAAGAPRESLADDVLNHLCWTAGLALGSGGEAVTLADLVGQTPAQGLDAVDVAGCILASALLPRCLAPTDWPDLLDEIRRPLNEFLATLEQLSGVPALAQRAKRHIDHRVLAEDTSRHARQRGSVFGCDVEITTPLEPIEVPPGVERVVVRAQLEGEPIGDVLLAPFDGEIPTAVIADALARSAWPILGRLFARTVYPRLRMQVDAEGTAVIRGDTVVAQGLPPDIEADTEAFHDAVGWTIFLQELFARPEWAPDQFYDSASSLPGRGTAHWDEREIELAEQGRPFVASGLTTNVVIALGGVPLGVVRVRSRGGIVEPNDILRAACTASGFELARIAVREGVIGRPLLASDNLRSRLAETARATRAARQTASGKTPAELVLGRTRPFDIGGPQSRTAALPASAAPELFALARSAGGAVEGAASPNRVRYDPAMLRPGARILRRNVSRRRQQSGDGVKSQLLPILMYHRIDEPQGGLLDRYILAPERFEEQLRLLRAEGFESCTFDQVGEFVRARRPPPGRRVVLTFDDAFTDFLTHASPLLAAYDLDATLFVPTGHVGGTNAWDAAYGNATDLLTWRQLRSLARRGTEIGSHSVTHPFLTTISLEDVTREAAVSRTRLIDELGVDPAVFSYPYGDSDAAVRSVIGGCGYAYAVTTEGRPANATDDRLALPRLEVASSLGLDAFAALIGLS